MNGLPLSGHVFRVERRRGPQWYVLGGGVGQMVQLARANLRNIPAIAQR